MKLTVMTEAELEAAAAALARRWRESALGTLLMGLRGPLGSGKTTWVRAMLRGLGFRGRVPSPTYTLLEQYRVGGLAVVHVDLYRLRGPEEIESLGLRDELDAADAWLLVEWPERAPALLSRCDLVLDLLPVGETGRTVVLAAASAAGERALATAVQMDIKFMR